MYEKANRESQKVVSLVKMLENLPTQSFHFEGADKGLKIKIISKTVVVNSIYKVDAFLISTHNIWSNA